jgi:hypothetical protein
MENDRDILLVSIMTFITIFAWIFFELVKTTKTTTIPDSTAQLLKPINPRIDTATLENLKERQIFR